MADNPKDFAYVPDPKLPSTWKLNISDATHIADAITALTSGFRGNKVEIPAGDKSKVVSKIRGAINKLSDKDQKKNLLERLATVKAIETEKAFMGKLEPEDVNYIPLSTTKGEACANCRWFRPDMDSAYACFIVDASDADDEPILATGICDRWEANKEPAEDPMEELAETLVEALQENADAISNAVTNIPMPMYSPDMGKAIKKSVGQRIRALFTPKPKPDESFSVFKGTDGKWVWHAVYTNNFEDREGEILTEKGHDRYISRLDMKLVPMPLLDVWHVEGTEHGQADVIWREGHFIHAVGHFDDTPMAESAIKFYQKNAQKNSHAFTVPDWAFDGKHYDDFNTFKISTLPPHAAANPYTSFEEIQKEMALTDEKRRHLEQVFGKEKLAEIEAADEQRGKSLEDFKVAYKDYAVVTPDKKPEPLTSDKEKALSVLFGDVVTMQDEMLQVMGLQKKAIESKDALITALKTEKDTQVAQLQADIKALQTIVNAPPQRPSQAQSTVVDPKTTTLKDQTPTDDPAEKFFGVPMKKVTN